MLPRLDGLEVCKRLRAQSTVPIIMLTARDDELDKVLGLELGADDYITKPFSIREFRSRVRALLRRASAPRHGHRRRLDDRGRGRHDRPRPPDGERVRKGRPAHLRRVRAPPHARLDTRAASTRARCCSRRSGAARTTASRGRSTSTSATCARSSSGIRASPSSFDGPRRRLPLQRAVSPFRSVGARLSLALLVVVAVALAIVYAIARPDPRAEPRRHQDRRSSCRSRRAWRAASRGPEPASTELRSRTSASSIQARVTIVSLLDDGAGAADRASDRRFAVDAVLADLRRPIAAEGRPDAERAAGAGRRAAAKSLRGSCGAAPRTGTSSSFSSSLEDTLANVGLVRRRLLLAGVLALLFSLAVGYGAAYLFARRLRRLERAADRIASGRLDEPVVDTGRDEVGQLAQAFDRMRRRLAQLEHARREFIANASHELRTPIFSLGGFLELLADEELDEDTRREFLSTRPRAGRPPDEARHRPARPLAARRGPRAARARAGRPRVARPGDLDRVRAAREDAGSHDRDRGRREPDRRRRRAPDTADRADPARERARHTPPGTPIRVRAAQNNGRAQLIVEDEGPGIPPGSRGTSSSASTASTAGSRPGAGSGSRSRGSSLS